MSSTASAATASRTQKRARVTRDANAGEAIPGVLNDVVIARILKPEYFDDPADLARLRVVSSAMRDAVAATGFQFELLDEYRAAELGCLRSLEYLQRKGRLWRQEYLCEAAARSGKLEKLKTFRQNNTPWGKTCYAAAKGGHLEVLQWARANGCPWNKDTCEVAAEEGHLEVLQWARANGCPWDEKTGYAAARGGHLEVLQWLRANGCPWDEETCEVAERLDYVKA